MNAVYARQSLDKKDSMSIETQIELCKAEIGGEPLKIYIDKGFSGKNTNRPHFREMMADIKQGLVDRVIVYKLDRLSRSLLDFAEMMDNFKRYNVSFNSTREKFDTSTPIGNAMLSIIMVFAQLERETIQIRVQDNYLARSAKGAYDCIAPFGFSKQKVLLVDKPVSSLVINDETALMVQDIFDTYAFNETSLGYMARQLNKKGIPSPTGVQWDSCKLSRIMANPVYVKADADIYQYYKSTGINITNALDEFLGVNGCVTYGKWDHSGRKFAQLPNLKLSIGLHRGIIDSDTFLRCQYKLNGNEQIDNSSRGKHSWLTGLIKCGVCNRALKVTFNLKKSTTKCFVCSGVTNYGTCSENKRMPVDEVEGIVEDEIFRHVHMRKDLSVRSSQREDAIDKQYKIDIAKVDAQIENLLQAVAEGSDLTVSYINKRIAELEVGKKKLVQKQQLHTLSRTSERELKQFGDILTMWNGMTIEQKHEVASMLITTVKVSTESIIIDWKYKFDS